MTAFESAWTLLKNAPNPNYLYHRGMPSNPPNQPYQNNPQPNPYAPSPSKEGKQRTLDEYMERMKQNAPYGQGNPNDNNLPYNPYQPQPKPFEAKRNPFEHERPPYQQNNPQYRRGQGE